MQQRFIHSVVFSRDGEQIHPEVLKVGNTYHISGIDDQTYEKIEAEAEVISLYHMRQIRVGNEVFGFSPKKYKNVVKFKFTTFVYAKSNSCITTDEAKKLLHENIVYAVGKVLDDKRFDSRKELCTSEIKNIITCNGVMYIETLNTLYKCE